MRVVVANDIEAEVDLVLVLRTVLILDRGQRDLLISETTSCCRRRVSH